MKKQISQKVQKCTAYAVVVLSVVLLGIFSGVTYSKYFTKIDGEGSATVARWSFKANNETERIANVRLNKNYDNNKLLEDTIAPGTTGSFDIILDTNGADVGIDYEIKFDNLENKPKNLEFSYDGTTANSLKGLEDVLKGRIGINDPRVKTITVNWNWEYETPDIADTNKTNDEIDTEDAGKSFTFDIIIKGTQVNPSEVTNNG